MQRISKDKRTLILALLTEGNTVNGICRMLKVGKNNLLRYLKDVGEACEDWHNENVKGCEVDFLELDESWSYIGKHKERMTKEEKLDKSKGDSWLWAGICRDSKAIISWLVADRKQTSCVQFCSDLSARIEGEVTITTDALKSYEWGIGSAFGTRASHAVEHKNFENLSTRRPQDKRPIDRLVGTDRKAVSGDPDLKLATTSHIERIFLTVRQGNKRCARKTQANSKKLENHRLVMSIHMFTYNMCRKHESIKTTPMHKLGIISKPWTLLDVVEMTETYQAKREEAQYEEAFAAADFNDWKPRKGPQTFEPKKPEAPWYHDPNGQGKP